MKKLSFLTLQTAACWKCVHPAYVTSESFLHQHVSHIANSIVAQLANLPAGYLRCCHLTQLTPDSLSPFDILSSSCLTLGTSLLSLLSCLSVDRCL